MNSEKILYIDFEGNTSEHLYLVGYSFDGNFHQVVLDQDLKGLADHHAFKLMSLHQFAEEISKVIKNESITTIASYTTHDVEILRENKQFKDCMENLALDVLDVHKVVKSFIRKNHLNKFRNMVESLPKNYHRKRYSLINVIDHLLINLTKKTSTTLDDMVAPMVRKTLRVVVVVLVFVQIAQVLSDKPITSILAGLGVGGLAVALAAQEAIKNFFGSLIIFTDKPFELGERICVSDYDGFVEEVGFRSTRIRTLDGHLVTIPNGELASQ